MSEQPSAVEPIYHITTRDLWSEVEGRDRYAAPSLDTEGFIHCSMIGQVERSLNRFFASEEAVIVLTIDPQMLDVELRFEPAHGEQFPHIYGELVLVAVIAAEMVSREADGRYSYPPEV